MKATTRFSEDVRPITELKLRASEVVDHARTSRRLILLTRRGRGVAVLLSLDEYERLTDRAAFVEAVEEGVRAARTGDLHPHAEALKILDSFGTQGDRRRHDSVDRPLAPRSALDRTWRAEPATRTTCLCKSG